MTRSPSFNPANTSTWFGIFEAGLDFARLHPVLLIDDQHAGLAVVVLHRLNRNGQRVPSGFALRSATLAYIPGCSL